MKTGYVGRSVPGLDTLDAVQVHGGYGVVRGSRDEYLYRTIRALRIYEGTSEIQRLTITRSATRRGDK
jgi:acyl-CoA dehydrogenase